MKYFILFFLLLFLGCSPKYRVTHEYIKPTSSNSNSCLSSCQLKVKACQKDCKENFDRCKIKADDEAKKIYKQKLHDYQIKLEQYASDMQMYQLQSSLYYDSFWDYRYGGRYCDTIFFPHELFWGPPISMYMPQKPVKPILQDIIEKEEMSMCKIDCGCAKLYDDCFIGCGGVIKSKRVCINNCPNSR